MAFSSGERDAIARWMCWPPQSETYEYQSLVTRIQSQADGGAELSSDRESRVRGFLARLATLDTQIDNLNEQMQADTIGALRIDPVRAMMALHLRGRTLVNNIAQALNTTPLGDAFGTPSTVPR